MDIDNSGFPSVWGRHQTALIEPMLVRGRLITSITEAPSGWDARLSSLSFKRTNHGWIKLGGLEPSEFSYISPEIDLIGFRLDLIQDCTDELETIVPYDVRDALLALWQHQIQTVMVALSMEHDTTHTRSQAWSFVEAAMSGEITAETETLFGLTFTKMSRSVSGLSTDAERFAGCLGWRGTGAPVKEMNAEPLLFRKGENVTWLDRAGIQQTGRLARKVRVSDSGCWVIHSPRWVGGYSMAVPAWIERSQLYFPHDPEDWLSRNPANESELIAVGDQYDSNSTAVTTASDNQLKLLGYYLHGPNSHFPPVGGVEPLFNEMRDDQSWGSHAADLFSQENFDWLQGLAAQLAIESRKLYGSAPISIIITNGLYEDDDLLVRVPSLTLAVTLGVTREIARRENLVARLALGNQLNIAAAVDELETHRSKFDRELRLSSRLMGEASGVPGDGIIPISNYHLNSPSFWPKVSEFYEGRLLADDIFRIKSVLMRGVSDLKLRAVAKPLISEFYSELGLLSDSEEATAPKAIVFVGDASCDFLSIDAVVGRLNSPARLFGDWATDLPVIRAPLYEASVKHTQGISLDLPTGISVGLLGPRSGSIQSRHFYSTPEQAIEKYVEILNHLEHKVDKESCYEISHLKQLANKYELYKRMLLVPRKLSLMPGTELRERVKAQALMQAASKIAPLSDAGLERFITQLTEGLVKDKCQGVVCLLSSTATARKWRFDSVDIDSSALVQSRAATLENAFIKLKKNVRGRGVSILIDGIAIADPELAEILNGDGPAVLKKSVEMNAAGYQDTGVVAGFAMKDIRRMRCTELLDAADVMSDEQKAKYITRELIWPRASFEEMKEAGIDLHAAFAIDLHWKSMPKTPLTSSREHIRGYITLLTAYKEAVAPLAMLPYLAEEGTESYCSQITKVTNGVWLGLPDAVRQQFRGANGVRGYPALNWQSFNPERSSKLSRDMKDLSWSDVLKSKKIKAPTKSGSRVSRDELVRVGPDYRSGMSVSEDDFIKTFGFSGVEYGNWTNQAEREKHLNLAYDSMMDFARVMGWEPMALSLGGKLGLCIGSRGRGGKNAANAHFEPANMAINLTRMRGDGALAHEYFHAVARHYGRMSTGASVDFADTVGYLLQKDGSVPGVAKTGLRSDVQKAFQDLLVAVMRKPEIDESYDDINTYTHRSRMLIDSMSLDSKSNGDYWGSPREMFARAMEVWFKDRLRDAGERNDYLVGTRTDHAETGVYPDTAHLSRIDKFAGYWMDSIEQSVSAVQHPFLGSIEMPILKTELKSAMPLTQELLAELVHDELDRLLAKAAPNVELLSDPGQRAGYYDLSRDLLMLNAHYADRETFYHEAWHVCSGKLLTTEERYGMARIFSVDGDLAGQVERLLLSRGASRDVIEHMRSDTHEVQAYAFQLWKEGVFTFRPDSRQSHAAFCRVGIFVDGVTGLGGYFGADEAESLFSRFLSGELAEMRTENSTNQDIDCAVWDSDSVLYWSTDDSPKIDTQAYPSMRMH